MEFGAALCSTSASALYFLSPRGILIYRDIFWDWMLLCAIFHRTAQDSQGMGFALKSLCVGRNGVTAELFTWMHPCAPRVPKTSLRLSSGVYLEGLKQIFNSKNVASSFPAYQLHGIRGAPLAILFQAFYSVPKPDLNWNG